MHVTLQQLAYFVALADVRSFTGAADSLGVAQPTLSRQFKALEDELGAALVHRTRGAVTLTPAGDAVLPLARRMLADMEAARVAVAELVGLQRGRVRVGATPSLCIGVLADVLRVFHERYPAIHLELAENGSQLLVSSLLRNEIDIALVIVPAEGLDAGLQPHTRAAGATVRGLSGVEEGAVEPGGDDGEGAGAPRHWSSRGGATTCAR